MMTYEKNGSELRAFTTDTNSRVSTKESGMINEVRVGVGGLFITNVNCEGTQSKCVLLYKRPHDPERFQWSLPGGSVTLFQGCETVLAFKASKRLHDVDVRNIIVLDVIVAVNHYNEEEGYHFVSPQYYIDIKDFETLFYVAKNPYARTPRNKIPVKILNTKKKLLNSMSETNNKETTEDKPLLSVVPIDIIEKMDSCERERIFIKTTIEAILAHCEMRKNIEELNRKLGTYRSWRMSQMGKLKL